MIRILCLTVAVMSTALSSTVSAQQTAKVTASGIGYLEYLPDGYHSNSNKYPVVISLHGIKEKGTTSTDRNKIIADLPRVANVGLPKYVKYGTKYPFILISPQLKSNMGLWTSDYIMKVVSHIKKTLRVDDRRIYLTGLSLGGFGAWRTVGDYPDVFAAMVSVCAGGNALNKADVIAAKNLPIWAFHGNKDRTVSYTVTTKMINAINSAPKKPNPLAKLTILQGMDHAIWDKVYKETKALDWMLSHRKGSAPPKDVNTSPSTNQVPVVSAGPDRVLVLPTNSITIQGTASDRDGKVVSYAWSKTYGKQASFSGANTSKVRIYNLEKGVYIFKLSARDDDGGVKDDYFKITVTGTDNKSGSGTKSGAKNVAPVAYGGPDRVLTLPTNAVTIQGSASDKDGKIVAYQWIKTYGKRATLSGSNTSTVRISNLEPGVYIFRFTVRDDKGAVTHDYFKITVKDKNVAMLDPNGSESLAALINLPPEGV